MDISKKFIHCRKHGESEAYERPYVEGRKQRLRCHTCILNYRQKYRKIKMEKRKAVYKIPYEYKCAPLSGCIPIERYGYLGCHHCIGKWDDYQLKYLLAFKPQPYRWEWNQI